MNNFYYVYMLQSEAKNNKYYIGLTTTLRERLQQHNYGKGKYSRLYKPWKLITVVAFDSKIKAMRFEEYLKSHSGRAFAKKHF